MSCTSTRPRRARSLPTRAARLVAALVTGAAALAVPPATADEGPPVPPVASPVTVAGLPAVVYDAHRGGGMEARENSLSGFQAAVDSGAVQVLDLDTQQLADGTVVVFHDGTLDRTTTAHGPVSTLSAAGWAQVRLDLGGWLTPAPPPEAPPTLAEVLDRFGGRIVLTVEAKDPASLATIARLVTDRGLVGSVLVNTNDPSVARRIHDLGLATHLWRSAAQARGDEPAAWSEYVDVVDVSARATDADLHRFVRSGIPRVWARVQSTRAERDRLWDLGIRGFVVDAPRYVTGQTDTFPLVDTVVAADTPPATVQVSDRARVRVQVTTQSASSLPGVLVTADGPGTGEPVTARTDDTGRAVLTVPTEGTARRTGLSLVAHAGNQGEARWPDGIATVPLRLTREDLQVEVAPRLSGRRLVVRVVARDSAAASYRGPRHETGRRATVADLTSARLSLDLVRGGHVVRTLAAPVHDTGRAGDGVGSARFATRLSTVGAVTVRVTQTGPVYRRGTTRARVSAGSRRR